MTENIDCHFFTEVDCPFLFEVEFSIQKWAQILKILKFWKKWENAFGRPENAFPTFFLQNLENWKKKFYLSKIDITSVKPVKKIFGRKIEKSGKMLFSDLKTRFPLFFFKILKKNFQSKKGHFIWYDLSKTRLLQYQLLPSHSIWDDLSKTRFLQYQLFHIFTEVDVLLFFMR